MIILSTVYCKVSKKYIQLFTSALEKEYRSSTTNKILNTVWMEVKCLYILSILLLNLLQYTKCSNGTSKCWLSALMKAEVVPSGKNIHHELLWILRKRLHYRTFDIFADQILVSWDVLESLLWSLWLYFEVCSTILRRILLVLLMLLKSGEIAHWTNEFDVINCNFKCFLHPLILLICLNSLNIKHSVSILYRTT